MGDDATKKAHEVFGWDCKVEGQHSNHCVWAAELIRVEQMRLAASTREVERLKRENEALSSSNVWLNQGCVDYEKALAEIAACNDPECEANPQHAIARAALASPPPVGTGTGTGACACPMAETSTVCDDFVTDPNSRLRDCDNCGHLGMCHRTPATSATGTPGGGQ